MATLLLSVAFMLLVAVWGAAVGFCVAAEGVWPSPRDKRARAVIDVFAKDATPENYRAAVDAIVRVEAHWARDRLILLLEIARLQVENSEVPVRL